MKKLAVIFPGIGYHVDKPLLYYSRMIARECGYDIVEVPYKNFPKRIRGDAKKMRQAFDVGLDQAEGLLSHIDYSEYDQLLFLSKSIGTTIARAYALKKGLCPDHLMYTPLVETFEFPQTAEPFSEGRICAFHGSKDPWADTEKLMEACRKREIPLYITEGGNHSLETGDSQKDLLELVNVMEISRRFVNSLTNL